MSDIKHWLISACWFLFFTLGSLESSAIPAQPPDEKPVAQANILSFYKPAPTLWHDYQRQTPLRQRLSLHGLWQASCKDPTLSGEVQLPGAFTFEGQMILQRTFRLDSTFMNRPIRLVLQGANYETKVEINGELAGSHEGGYTPFAVDLRPERLFFDKENLLTLIVSNQLSPLQTLPAKQRPLGWLNEGGILREIYLEALPDIFIENARLQYDFDQLAAKLEASAEVRFRKNLTPEAITGVTAILEIWEADRSRKVVASAPAPLSATDKLWQALSLTCQLHQPTLWSPASPYLYAFRLAVMRQNLVLDEWWQETGFRQLQIADRQFRLNGQPFVVRGVNWVEGYSYHSVLLDTAKALQLVAQAKDLGANVIRLVGHPPHPFLPSFCDRAGIFLLEELPFYYLTEAHFRQPRFIELALLQAGEMMLRDGNHPSVLGWGLGTNSAMLSPEAKNNMNSLCQSLRRLDKRPLYAVAPLSWIPAWEPLVDFLLPDLFQHERLDHFTSMATASRKPLLPIIGFWAAPVEGQGELIHKNQPSNISARQHAEAEQHQAEKLGKLLESFETMPRLCGYIVQSLLDWPAPMPLLVLGPTAGRLQKDSTTLEPHGAIFIHPAGLIDSDGQRRLSFQVVQAFNRGDRRPMLIAKPLSPLHPQEYPIVGIGIILIIIFYLNRDRRLRGNLHRIFVHPHGFYVDLYENRKVAPFLSVLLGLVESCILATLFSGFCYANRESLIFDQVLNLLIGDPLWKARAVWLIWNPKWFIAGGTVGLFMAGAAIAIFMRILGFFLGSNLPTLQYFTFVFWTAANFLVLGIFAPFFYRLLLFADFTAPLLFLVASVCLWFVGRFFRGMRVIYAMSILRTMIIFGLIVGGLLISIALYYQRTEAIFEYSKYYWQLLNAGM